MTQDVKEQAEKFAVWRMGTKNEWECNYEDIAQATGVPLIRVKRICVANDWRCADIEDQARGVDLLMQTQSPIDVPVFHV